MEDYIGLEEFNRTLDTEEDIIECAIQLAEEGNGEQQTQVRILQDQKEC